MKCFLPARACARWCVYRCTSLSLASIVYRCACVCFCGGVGTCSCLCELCSCIVIHFFPSLCERLSFSTRFLLHVFVKVKGARARFVVMATEHRSYCRTLSLSLCLASLSICLCARVCSYAVRDANLPHYPPSFPSSFLFLLPVSKYEPFFFSVCFASLSLLSVSLLVSLFLYFRVFRLLVLSSFSSFPLYGNCSLPPLARSLQLISTQEA